MAATWNGVRPSTDSRNKGALLDMDVNEGFNTERKSCMAVGLSVKAAQWKADISELSVTVRSSEQNERREKGGERERERERD